MWFTVLVLSQLTPQARYELARTCTGHDENFVLGLANARPFYFHSTQMGG